MADLNWWVAGYEDGDGFWNDVDGHDDPPPTITDLQETEEVVVGYQDDDGVTHYITLFGGWEDFDDLGADVEDAADQYAEG